jgi:DNA modification methylase
MGGNPLSAPKRPFINRLNNLSPSDWLKFQKSWFIHSPPPRKKGVLRHPAKFPETLAQEFIEFFTKPGQTVLDPMVGTGSTLVAAWRTGRNSVGIELNPIYARLAAEAIVDERQASENIGTDVLADVILGDAAQAVELLAARKFSQIDYVLTSPPYWDMLHARGAATQTLRRKSSELDVVYSDDPQDLGNLHDYDTFLEKLVEIYSSLQPCLKSGAYLTIIVKNVKKGGKIYPLAWDLASRLGKVYLLKDERIWCQNDQRLAPYGLGSAWVSNTFHHYCLNFRNS